MIVRWTQTAAHALAGIEAYVALADSMAARRLVERLVVAAESLAEFPELGRVMLELPGLGVRELVRGNYRIVYRVVGDAVEVLSVFEGHRLPPAEIAEQFIRDETSDA